MLFSVNERNAGYSADPEHLEFLYQMIIYFDAQYEKPDSNIDVYASLQEVDFEQYYESDVDENGYIKNRAQFLLKNIFRLEHSCFSIRCSQKKTDPSSKDERFSFLRIEYSPINRIITVYIDDFERLHFGVGEYIKNPNQRKCVLALQALYRKLKNAEIKQYEETRINRNINKILNIFPDMQDSLLLIGQKDE